MSPTPKWPTGFQILDAVPSALAAQYPGIFVGVIAAPAKPGESPLEINSHLIVLETVRDPALEAEAASAYPAPMTVIFELAPHSQACLRDVQADVTAMWTDIQKARITMISVGQGASQVVVGITACQPSGERLATQWFAQRWGDSVQVKTCQVIPHTEST